MAEPTPTDGQQTVNLSDMGDYGQYRPANMFPQRYDEFVATLAQLMSTGGNSDLQAVESQKSLYLSAGGTEEGWRALVPMVSAFAIPGTTATVDGSEPIGVASTDIDAEYAARTAGLPALNGAVDSGPKYIGIGSRQPASGGNEPMYLEGAEFDEMNSIDPKDRIDLKQRMFAAGLYGDATASDIMLGGSQWTEGDKDAFLMLLGEANLNGTDWESALRYRVEYADRQGTDGLTPEQQSKLVDEGLTFQEDLQRFAANNGLKLSNDWIRTKYSDYLAGRTSLEQEKQTLREKYVANTFPAWKDEILNGQDVVTFAAPYITQMESMLEMPDGSIGLDDPLVRSAMQGVGSDGKPSYVPMYQFEYQVKQDPRYDETVAGMNEVASGMEQVYRDLMGGA